MELSLAAVAVEVAVAVPQLTGSLDQAAAMPTCGSRVAVAVEVEPTLLTVRLVVRQELLLELAPAGQAATSRL